MTTCDVCDREALDGWRGTVSWLLLCGCKNIRVCEEHGKRSPVPGDLAPIDRLHFEKYHARGGE